MTLSTKQIYKNFRHDTFFAHPRQARLCSCLASMVREKEEVLYNWLTKLTTHKLQIQKCHVGK